MTKTERALTFLKTVCHIFGLVTGLIGIGYYGIHLHDYQTATYFVAMGTWIKI